MKSGLRASTENAGLEAGAIVHSRADHEAAAEMRLRRNGRCGRRMRGMPEETPANKACGESAGRSL